MLQHLNSTRKTRSSYDLNFMEKNNDGSQTIFDEALKDLYKSFMIEYPIVSIEDPFDQDEWEHYDKMIVDLLVTNPKGFGFGFVVFMLGLPLTGIHWANHMNKGKMERS